MRQLNESGKTSAGSGYIAGQRVSGAPSGQEGSTQVGRLSLIVGAAGLLGYLLVLVRYDPVIWSPASWLILMLASALLAAVTFRIDRPGRESYYIDFDEFLLVVGLQYLAPPATVAALVGGYVIGAFIRRVPLYKTWYNAASRLTALSGAFTVASLLPFDWQLPANFVLFAVDRKSTRLNSSHVAISYAVFCLKKKR